MLFPGQPVFCHVVQDTRLTGITAGSCRYYSILILYSLARKSGRGYADARPDLAKCSADDATIAASCVDPLADLIDYSPLLSFDACFSAFVFPGFCILAPNELSDASFAAVRYRRKQFFFYERWL